MNNEINEIMQPLFELQEEIEKRKESKQNEIINQENNNKSLRKDRLAEKNELKQKLEILKNRNQNRINNIMENRDREIEEYLSEFYDPNSVYSPSSVREDLINEYDKKIQAIKDEYEKEEQDLKNQIKELEFVTEQEKIGKEILNSLHNQSDYSVVDHKEMMETKDIVRRNLIAKKKELSSQLDKEKLNYRLIMQEISEFKPEYDSKHHVTSASRDEYMSLWEKSNESVDRINNIKSQLDELDKYIEMTNYTDEELNASVRSLAPYEKEELEKRRALRKAKGNDAKEDIVDSTQLNNTDGNNIFDNFIPDFTFTKSDKKEEDNTPDDFIEIDKIFDENDINLINDDNNIVDDNNKKEPDKYLDNDYYIDFTGYEDTEKNDTEDNNKKESDKDLNNDFYIDFTGYEDTTPTENDDIDDNSINKIKVDDITIDDISENDIDVIDDEVKVDFNSIKNEGNVYEMPTKSEIAKLIYSIIEHSVKNVNGIKLENSKGKLSENEKYVSVKTDEDETFNLIESSEFDGITNPGIYYNKDEIKTAIKDFYKKTKGTKYIVSEINEKYKVNRKGLRKFKSALKKCSAIKLIREKKISEFDLIRFIGKDETSEIVSEAQFSRIESLPEDDYVNRNDVIVAIRNSLLRPQSKFMNLLDKLSNDFSNSYDEETEELEEEKNHIL